MENFTSDLISAARSVASAKRFAAIVIATLALGVGANAAVFGVLDAVVLRPLPYDEPDRLVRAYHRTSTTDDYFPGLLLIEYRNRSRTLDIAAVYTYSVEGLDLTDRARPERVQSLKVSANYFEILGAAPLVGRMFDRADEVPNARIAVVSERIWREYLGGAMDAAGRSLSLNGIPHRVAAVLPGTFVDPLQPDVEVWTPINMQAGGSNSWSNHYLSAVAKLRPGATVAQSEAELSAIGTQMKSSYDANGPAPSVRVAPLQEDTVGRAGPILWLLFGAVGLLLVIACVNIAGLVLARSAARESELAIRAALGCARWRLVRHLVLESLLLSVAGGISGLLLGAAVTRALLAAAPDVVARSGGESSLIVFAFGLGVAILAGLAFGLAPALQFARPGLERVLRETSRSASGSRRQVRFRNGLVVCQIALALVLVIGAGLLVRSFQRLSSVNLGIRPDNVLTFEVHLPSGRYADPQARADFHVELQRRIAAIQGVRSVGAVSRLPVTGPYHVWGTTRPDRPNERGVSANQRVVEGEYFRTLGIPVVRGRTFTPQDRTASMRRVVINQAFVRRMFPSEDPIGVRLRTGGADLEVIGVVGDVSIGVREPIRPMVYHSHSQFAANRLWALTQIVSIDRPAAGVLTELGRELSAIDAALVLHRPRMLADVVRDGIEQERFAMLVIGVYAVLALTLAAVGVYGVLSYAVSRRRRELGIRIALGAQLGSVRALVVKDGFRLAVGGVLVGLAVASVATRVLRSMLFSVSAVDPVVFVLASAALVAVALAASVIPARTATRVDPLDAVRADS